MKALETLFLDELGDMYDAEQHLLDALPRMAEAATDNELRKAFEMHLSETEGHVAKVEKVFEAFGQPAKVKKCAAIRGLIKESERIISDNRKPPPLTRPWFPPGKRW